MQNQLTNLTNLLTKFVNTNNASTSSLGTLPSNTIANPRTDLKAITTRSGVSYDGPQILPPPSFLPKVVENKPKTTKDTVHPTNNESTEDVQPLVVQSESLILTSKPVNSPIFEPVISNLNFNISFADALILMPKFGPSIKSLLTNKDKLCELARTPLLTKFVNSNNASTSSSSTLPSNAIANPRIDLKSITARSGVSYDGPHILPLTSFLPKVVENEPEATKDTVHPTNNGSTEDVQPQVVQSKSPILTSKPVISPTIEPIILQLVP
nr:reverse transcriptase domain-containing protein [Tanacetum cinerariifolium]